MEASGIDNRNSKDRLIDAVRILIKEEGYGSLRPTKIAKIAGVDKKMIYYHFKDVDGLISAYHESKDGWIRFGKLVKDAVENSKITSKESIVSFYLRKQFEQLSACHLHDRIMEYELCKDVVCPMNLHEERNQYLEKLFALLKDDLIVSESRYRAILALLIGGINYLAASSGVEGKKICGFDLSKEYDRAEICNALVFINSFLFADVDKKENVN